jgi:prophage antirepressor-like protein
MTTETQLSPFQFQSLPLRVVADEHGNPWFCAKDACDILGYGNSREAVLKHCQSKGVTIRDTLTEGGNQKLSYISEGNLYRLIIKSNKPEAEPFESWVCDEVLPTIRKTGSYSAGKPKPVNFNREGTDISVHRVRCYFALKQAGHWMTNEDIAKAAKVSKRTARHYTKLFCEERIVDRLRLSPGHQFKMADDAGKANERFIRETELAASVFGLAQTKLKLSVV